MHCALRHVRLLNGAYLAQFCSAPFGTTIVNGAWRKCAPFALASRHSLGIGQCAPFTIVDRPIANGAEQIMGKEERKKELEDELAELRAEIADLDKRLEYADRSLLPVRRIRWELEATLKQAYAKDTNGVVTLDLNNQSAIDSRKPLFMRLLYIAERFGREFEERRQLAQQSKAYQRAAQKIVSELAKTREKRNHERDLGGCVHRLARGRGPGLAAHGRR